MTDEITWEEPSPTTGRDVYPAIAVTLMERPGEWAVIRKGRGARNNQTYVKTRLTMLCQPGRVEVTGRMDDGVPKLYARYLPPEEAT